MKLGVNVDHVATLREARKIVDYPDPLAAALVAQRSGADSIVVHLRTDERHIKEKDVRSIKKKIKVDLNLEMSVHPRIVAKALAIRPQKATIVPERRQEITTEGGLDLMRCQKRIVDVLRRLRRARIAMSVFIAPSISQIIKAKDLGIDTIELHTGKYANAKTKKEKDDEFRKIFYAAKFAKNLGFFVAAGHGLHYGNTKRIAKIKYIDELNIGHSIIAESVFLGIAKAVRTMKSLIR
ncbi:pyridoxine 5'-phosphate synthase [Candidatus Omnitrophota bacterium]